MMAGLEQIKAAKLLGKRLRKAREGQGFNLAILASSLKLSVVQLVAIEDGNLFAFDHSLEAFSESANLYAQKVGVDLSETTSSVKKVISVTANKWEVSIPLFLRKHD